MEGSTAVPPNTSCTMWEGTCDGRTDLANSTHREEGRLLEVPERGGSSGRSRGSCSSLEAHLGGTGSNDMSGLEARAVVGVRCLFLPSPR